MSVGLIVTSQNTTLQMELELELETTSTGDPLLNGRATYAGIGSNITTCENFCSRGKIITIRIVIFAY